MHLYRKRIDDISWQDLEDFCSQKVAENSYLDYKADFSENLYRTIAAMANTYGGIVLIGVSEDGQSKPVTPVSGIDLSRGIEDRVINIVVGNVSPPIIPEIAVCQNEGGDKAIVVVRIQPSEQTPHVTHKNTRVYVRTGSRNSPEELADLSRIEWLKDKRRESVRFRDGLLNRARERFMAARDGRVPGIPGTDEGRWKNPEKQPALLTLALCPLYPDPGALVTPSELNSVRRDIVIRDYMGTGYEFPLQESGCINRLVQDGVIMHYSGRKGSRTYHTHLNVHGLFLFKQSLLYNPPNQDPEVNSGDEGGPVIRGFEFFCRAFQVVESGAKFYDRIGYAGSLQFKMRFENLLGQAFWRLEFESGRLTNYRAYSCDEEVDMAQQVATYDLANSAKDVVHPFAERVGWAFDWEVTEQFMDQLYQYMVEH